MVRRLPFVQGNCEWLWEKFIIYDGNILSEWYEVIVCSGKVVSVYVLSDRIYVYQYSSNV